MKALWPRPERIALAPATPAERASVVALARALRAQPPAALAQEDAGKAWAEQAEAAGFALEVWRVGADDPCDPRDSADAPAGAGWFWVLRERGDLRGHGTYLFRAGPDQEARHHGAAIILQAPHAYFERGTGALALAVLLAAADDGRAPDMLMTDSLHRYQQASGARSKQARNPADVCHEPTHLFQEVTAALADGPSAFVQIHGFAVPGDNTAHGRRRTDHPEIIVSAGRAHGSTLHSTAVADAWAQIFGAPAVRRYPEEIDVLGGTTNVQARLLHARTDAAFVHVELSSTMRARLLASDEERAAWARALLQALRCSLASP